MMQSLKDIFKGEQSSWPDQETEYYKYFSRLSAITMELRNHGVQSGEISRVSQYVSKMIVAFDNLKIIFLYRTPVTLRAYSKVFIYVFPVIYGPYFASTFHDFSASLEYVMPVLYSFILVSLDNIQDHLENRAASFEAWTPPSNGRMTACERRQCRGFVRLARIVHGQRPGLFVRNRH